MAHVTMVKKRLANGEPCQKCKQAEEMLRRRGVWDQIDEVVWAHEDDPESAGRMLAVEHGVDLAPFFLVREGDELTVYTSALKLVKEALTVQEPAQQASRILASGPLVEGEVTEAAGRLQAASPQEILGWALERLGGQCAIAFSGAEDVALIDMAAKSGQPFSVFSLDTGRLHPETYRFFDRVRRHYGVEIEFTFPNAVSVENLVRKKGMFSFYDDGHFECCGIRKVEPLRRVLGKYSGWVTGQRRDQSPTRAEVPAILWDASHRSEGMLKVNPLASVSQAEVWKYIRDNDVPYNELHDRGFISIGCEPCTRPTRPGEHERAGRWWWEEATQRECGLHK